MPQTILQRHNEFRRPQALTSTSSPATKHHRRGDTAGRWFAPPLGFLRLCTSWVGRRRGEKGGKQTRREDKDRSSPSPRQTSKSRSALFGLPRKLRFIASSRRVWIRLRITKEKEQAIAPWPTIYLLIPRVSASDAFADSTSDFNSSSNSNPTKAKVTRCERKIHSQPSILPSSSQPRILGYGAVSRVFLMAYHGRPVAVKVHDLLLVVILILSNEPTKFAIWEVRNSQPMAPKLIRGSVGLRVWRGTSYGK